MGLIQNIKSKIYTIRGFQVILDRDLAKLYCVKTKALNQAVKRNIERFPKDFCFQLTKEEFDNWKSQIVTTNSDKMGLRKMPFVFTEQGVAALSGILKSKKAIEVNIKIVRTFISMRKFLSNNSNFFQKFNQIDKKLLEYDNNFDKIFEAIEDKQIKLKKGIFFQGQIFDSYNFVSDLIRSASKSIILIDNYIDDSTLTLFTKTNTNVKIYTKKLSKQLKLDIEKYNEQYNPIKIKTTDIYHDRFLIIDDKEIYHIGASLKDT